MPPTDLSASPTGRNCDGRPDEPRLPARQAFAIQPGNESSATLTWIESEIMALKRGADGYEIPDEWWPPDSKFPTESRCLEYLEEQLTTLSIAFKKEGYNLNDMPTDKKDRQRLLERIKPPTIRAFYILSLVVWKTESETFNELGTQKYFELERLKNIYAYLPIWALLWEEGLPAMFPVGSDKTTNTQLATATYWIPISWVHSLRERFEWSCQVILAHCDIEEPENGEDPSECIRLPFRTKDEKTKYEGIHDQYLAVGTPKQIIVMLNDQRVKKKKFCEDQEKRKKALAAQGDTHPELEARYNPEIRSVDDLLLFFNTPWLFDRRLHKWTSQAPVLENDPTNAKRIESLRFKVGSQSSGGSLAIPAVDFIYDDPREVQRWHELFVLESYYEAEDLNQESEQAINANSTETRASGAWDE